MPVRYTLSSEFTAWQNVFDCFDIVEGSRLALLSRSHAQVVRDIWTEFVRQGRLAYPDMQIFMPLSTPRQVTVPPTINHPSYGRTIDQPGWLRWCLFKIHQQVHRQPLVLEQWADLFSANEIVEHVRASHHMNLHYWVARHMKHLHPGDYTPIAYMFVNPIILDTMSQSTLTTGLRLHTVLNIWSLLGCQGLQLPPGDYDIAEIMRTRGDDAGVFMTIRALVLTGRWRPPLGVREMIDRTTADWVTIQGQPLDEIRQLIAC